ncbi:MAG: TonB-dependent receptor, partial [Gammaproteobacteria bacterium]|nr:TonB-dependent receptor [Gammaproteobacteria bacterium]
MLSKSLSLAFLAGILSSASAVYAVEDDASNESVFNQAVLEELVVSEFRQSLPVDVNTSLTQLNQIEIEDFSLQHFEELVQLVPNMNFSGDGSRARYFQLRGIGELEQYEGAPNPSIGFIIDEIDLSGVGGVTSTFDMQQVEVLRGPQGTRFGSGALAGLVFAQSAEPTVETSVNAELMIGNDDQIGIGAAVGGSLGGNLQARVSVHQYHANGFRDNKYLQRDDTNGRDELNLRGKLNWQIGKGWEAKFSGLYADYQNGYDAWVIDNGPDTYSDKPGDDWQKTAAGSVKVSGPLGAAVEFVSITSYATSDIVFSYDADWGNNDGYWPAPFVYDYFARTDRERDSITQEFRFLSSEDGRILNDTTDWLLGMYGRSLDEKNDENLIGFYEDGGFCTPGACDERTNLKSGYDSSNIAAFGKLDSSLSERWSLALGLRVERWQADYSDTKTDLFNDPNNPVSKQFSPSDNMWGGDITLSYKVSDAANLYGLISRGYKAGGFNPSVARIDFQPGDQFSDEDKVYEPEALINYEVGYKGRWLEGRLIADVSVFYMDRQDMQLVTSVQNVLGDPFSFTFITSNGAGHSYGLETSASWQFADNWQLFGALGLLKSEVDKYKFEFDEPVVGREFAHAPPYTFNVGTSYRDGNGWMGRLDVVGKGAFYYDYSHSNKSESYQLVNLKLGKEWERWGVYAWGRNIFDKEYYTRGFYFGNEPPAFDNKLYTKYGDPRTYGVT